MRPSNLENIDLGGLRQKTADFLETKGFVNFITAVILLSALTLGLETDRDLTRKYGGILHAIDLIVLTIFTFEIGLKFYAYRLSFFRVGWNVFDFLIVTISLIPSSGALAVMRTLRVLRVLRLVSVVPSMRRVIAALLHSIPGMASIMSVLLIIYYVSAVLATRLFMDHPEPDVAALFESIPASMYTLFQVMTLEGWSAEVVRPVMNVYPMAWLFFIPFIIITSFAVLNLFIGIIVDAMNIIHDRSEDEQPASGKDIKALHKDIAEIKKLLKAKK